jgi:hypothetical protein
MFPLLLVTAGSLAVLASALTVVDCALASFDLAGGDPLRFCSDLSALGVTEDVYLAVASAVFAAVVAMAAWIRTFKRWRKKKRIDPDKSLASNIDRLSTMSIIDEAAPPPSSDSPLAELEHRVSSLEDAFTLSPEGSRDFTSSWIGLLREANELHNSGDLGTSDFKLINTRLLDLLKEPSQTSG